jgi:hypothetical protein
MISGSVTLHALAVVDEVFRLHILYGSSFSGMGRRLITGE